MIKEKTLIPVNEFRCNDGKNVSLNSILSFIQTRASNYDIPLECTVDQIKSGNLLFGSSDECIVLRDPTGKALFKYVVTVRHQGKYVFITVQKTNGFSPDSAFFAGAEAARSAFSQKEKQIEAGWYAILNDIINELFQ